MTAWCGRYRSWVVAGLVTVLAACGSGRQATTPAGADGAPAVAVTPTPAPVESPVAARSCQLPAVSPERLNCWKADPELLDALEKAMDAAIAAHPENYDFENMKCGNCYLVRDHDAFYAEVTRQLLLQGVCSDRGADEITLKSDNGWSEQFDIMLGSGHIRRGEGSYLYTCTPAMF